MLQQAIERVGVDRKAVNHELKTGTFETIVGTRKLENQQIKSLYLVAQWQDGEFNAVWPQNLPGTTAYRTNKPEWQ